MITCHTCNTNLDDKDYLLLTSHDPEDPSNKIYQYYCNHECLKKDLP